MSKEADPLGQLWVMLDVISKQRDQLPGQAKAEADKPDAGPSDEETTPVFLSWAHADDGWDAEQAEVWRSQVIAFAVKLRRLGIDLDMDAFHAEDMNVDWTRWGPAQVRDAKTTIVVISQGWAERWNGTNTPTHGAGAVAEADELRGIFQQDQAEFQRRCVVVMFPGVDNSVLPNGLARVNRFMVDPDDPDAYEPLVRSLTGQPSIKKPPLGQVPELPVRGGALDEKAEVLRLSDEAQSLRNKLKTATPLSSQERDRLAIRESLLRSLVDELRED